MDFYISINAYFNINVDYSTEIITIVFILIAMSLKKTCEQWQGFLL